MITNLLTDLVLKPLVAGKIQDPMIQTLSSVAYAIETNPQVKRIAEQLLTHPTVQEKIGRYLPLLPSVLPEANPDDLIGSLAALRVQPEIPASVVCKCPSCSHVFPRKLF